MINHVHAKRHKEKTVVFSLTIKQKLKIRPCQSRLKGGFQIAGTLQRSREGRGRSLEGGGLGGLRFAPGGSPLPTRWPLVTGHAVALGAKRVPLIRGMAAEVMRRPGVVVRPSLVLLTRKRRAIARVAVSSPVPLRRLLGGGPSPLSGGWRHKAALQLAIPKGRTRTRHARRRGPQ